MGNCSLVPHWGEEAREGCICCIYTPREIINIMK